MRQLMILLTLLPLALPLSAATEDLTLRAGAQGVTTSLSLTTPSVDAVFAPIASRIEYVGSYDAATETWQVYRPSDPAFVSASFDLDPGVGYVVSLTPGPDVSMTLNGDLPTLAERIVAPGWNLVGTFASEERVWASIFGDDKLAVERLARFTPADISGFVLGDPEFDEGTQIWNYIDFGGVEVRNVAPGEAYWIESPGFTLGPQLALEMEGDFDGGLDTCTGFPTAAETDEDINGDGVMNYGNTVWTGTGYAVDACGREVRSTQDTIAFRVPKGGALQSVTVLSHAMTVLNSGDRQGTAPYAGNDELRFEIDLDGELSNWLEVTPSAGTCRGPLDATIVQLRADMAGLTPGEVRTGVMTVRSNGGTRAVNVRLEVPLLDGLFVGSADVGLVQNGVVRTTRNIQVRVAGSTMTLLAEHTPWLNADLDAPIVETSPGVFTATFTQMVSEAESEIFRAYTRTVSLVVERKSDADNTCGVLLPLIGDYTESVTGLGSPFDFMGRVMLLRVIAD